MLPDDIPVWWQYLDSPNCPRYETVYYNVAMTSVEPSTIPGPKNLANMWLYNISKRIDAVACTPTKAHIIEVTGRAGIRSLGQIISYKRLWEHTKPLPIPFSASILCLYSDPDVIFVSSSHDISIIELTPIELLESLKAL